MLQDAIENLKAINQHLKENQNNNIEEKYYLINLINLDYIKDTKIINKEYINNVIDALKKDYYQSENCHIAEDIVKDKFLQAIVENQYNSIEEIKELAELLVQINDLQFARWFS